jgi:hypothetical protein
LQLQTKFAAGGAFKPPAAKGSQFFGAAACRAFRAILLEASPRRDSFWLFVVSRGGGLAKHLFHGF